MTWHDDGLGAAEHKFVSFADLLKDLAAK